MDALRHAFHPLYQLRGGRGLRDVEILAESVNRDKEAAMFLGLLGEPGLLSLQLFGQSLVPLREN